MGVNPKSNSPILAVCCESDTESMVAVLPGRALEDDGRPIAKVLYGLQVLKIGDEKK